jgi:leucyl-tRNA synthetase
MMAATIWALSVYNPASMSSNFSATASMSLTLTLDRLRHKIVADADMPADALMALVKLDRQVKELLAGKTIVKEIVVPGRLVNFVVRD